MKSRVLGRFMFRNFAVMCVGPILSVLAEGICLPSIASAQQADIQNQSANASPTQTEPRYVSLKADQVNVRRGPSREHEVLWVFKRAGLPVEVLAEFEHWRHIRDSEGAEGWVYFRLLSERRTALILPWEKEKIHVPLNASRGSTSAVAQLEPGVLVNIIRCDKTWCKVTVNDLTGWVAQQKLWGVYSDESIGE